MICSSLFLNVFLGGCASWLGAGRRKRGVWAGASSLLWNSVGRMVLADFFNLTPLFLCAGRGGRESCYKYRSHFGSR